VSQDERVVRVSEVRMEGVGKRFGGSWAVRDISLSIRPGEFYTLLGPSGSGKTTLLRMLAGFITPDEGRIVVDDEPIDSVPPWKRNLGMVFRQYALWPHLSVFENVAFGLRERGVRGAELEGKVKAALQRVGLEGIEARRPSELMGDQRQRVAVARTMVVQPRLLLLDEPLSELDAQPRARMRVELARLHRDVGITTLYVTHDQAEALSLSTHIGVLSGGSLLQEGKPEEIYWKPRNAFVAEFVGAANLVPVRVTELREMGVVVETAGGARLPVSSGTHSWRAGARVLLCLRPEALRVEEAALAPGGIPGTVSGHVFEGSRQIYDVSIPGATVKVEMLTSALLGRSFRLGDEVKIEVSPETSVLLPDEGPGP
jgi:ABC-type Fe3+/spermidine/putrescine transport system ATPase subunit